MKTEDLIDIWKKNKLGLSEEAREQFIDRLISELENLKITGIESEYERNLY